MQAFLKSKGSFFYCSIGPYKGFKIVKDGPTHRVLLGKLTISFGKIDIDSLLFNLIEELKETDQQEIKITGYAKQIEKLEKTVQQVKDEKQTIVDRYVRAIDELSKEVDSINDDNTDLTVTNDELERQKEELENKITNLNQEIEWLKYESSSSSSLLSSSSSSS